MLKNFFKKKVSVRETTIPNHPAVNLTPSDEEELKKILRSALPNIEAGNNPLAWSYDPDLWLSGKLHYLIPQEVATKNDIAEFLNIIRDTTLNFPGGPFIWDINSLDNLVFLPTSNAEQKEKAGIFAAIYSSCDEPYKAYCDFVTRFLRQFRKNYHEAIANAENSTQSRTLVAMRAAAQILDFQRSLRAGLVGPSRESIKYFLSDTDEILIERFGEFDRPATQKVKFQCESVSVILPDYVRVSKTADDQINATFGEGDICRIEISRTMSVGIDHPEEFGVFLAKQFGERQGLTVNYAADGKAVIPALPIVKEIQGEHLQFSHFTIGTKRTVFTMTLSCPPVQNLPDRVKTRINEIINGVIATLSEEFVYPTHQPKH
ncbi:MAG: hypothetical protein LUQ11_00540 [Methylococcaceae bacterium]|nr:hypothetical protein [Methylococcaceae bacterium]